MIRRMFIFNAFSVLAALLLLFAVSNVVIRGVFNQYKEQSKSPPELYLTNVQNTLNNWDAVDGDWVVLDQQVGDLGYSLFVEQAGEPIYSSFDDYQLEFYDALPVADTWTGTGAFVYQNEGVLMVGIQAEGQTVTAMHQWNTPVFFGRPRIQSEMLSIVFSISGLSSIAVIVLLSVFFIRKQSRRAMIPVNALTEASRRMEQGDLTQPIAYEGKDEFKPVCTAFDSMQRHLLEEREKNAMYEKARTDMVAGISHDLRTPLTSVKGYIKGLRDGVATTPEKQVQYLDIAYRKACDMDTLLQRLFYFSKLDTGSLPLFLASADLGEFVQSFADDTRKELSHKGIQLILKCKPAAHPVALDAEQMCRVLSNLVENSIHYAGAEPLILTVTVWRERDQERLRFADNGNGVPEEHLPHLFEQFWRGDQARSRQGGEGSGLGLYIVKYIIEAHGGTVSARNEHGLVFEIALPCREEPS